MGIDVYTAIEMVMDRYYRGQESFFLKTLAQSVSDEQQFWSVTVYEQDIFNEIQLKTYVVYKDSQHIDEIARETR